jgi:hypothetical protein
MFGSQVHFTRRRTALAVTLWVALTLLCLPSPVLAGRATDPGVLVVQGKGLAREKAVATEAMTEAVTRAGWKLAPRTFAPQETEALAQCLLTEQPWACFAKTVRDNSIRRLALLSLESRATADGNSMTVVTVMIASVEQQDVAYSGRRYCQACSPDSLAKLTAAAAREVLERMYLDSGRTFLQVKSRPAGASVEVDGKPLGVTDAAFEILPGPHRVVIKHAKYPPQTRLVDVEEDKTAIVTVALDDAPKASRAAGPRRSETVPLSQPRDEVPPQPRPSLLVPKALAVAGAVIIVGGGVALALDEDAPAQSPPFEGSPSRRYLNTSPLGVGLLIGGAVLAGAGGWWWQASASPSPPKKATAALLFHPGGGFFSLTKPF